MPSKLLREKLKEELKKNIFLSENDKALWIKNMASYPENLLRYFYQILKKNNRQSKKYIKKAIDIRPELLQEVKTKAKNINIKIGELKESEKQNKPEDMLESELKKLT